MGGMTTASALPPPQNWREGRRFRAWELHQQGWKQRDIAAALGVTQGAVSQWLTRARTAGPLALRHQPPPGRQPRLSATQRAQLPGLLAQGAAAFGWKGALWTTRRVAALIQQQFGVRYHPAHVSRLLRQLDFSVQQPVPRASQRDAAAIQAWSTARWPAIKKKRNASGGP